MGVTRWGVMEALSVNGSFFAPYVRRDRHAACIPRWRHATSPLDLQRIASLPPPFFGVSPIFLATSVELLRENTVHHAC